MHCTIDAGSRYSGAMPKWVTHLWHKQKEDYHRSGQHHSTIEQSRSDDQVRTEAERDNTQSQQHHTSGVDDDGHLLGVVEDLDLDISCDHGENKGHHL